MFHNPTSAFGARRAQGGLPARRETPIALRPRYIRIEADRPPERWPIGIGLAFAAFFSLAIWAGLAFGAITLLTR